MAPLLFSLLVVLCVGGPGGMAWEMLGGEPPILEPTERELEGAAVWVWAKAWPVGLRGC